MRPFFKSLALVTATLLLWAYGLHLYHAANRPLALGSAAADSPLPPTPKPSTTATTEPRTASAPLDDSSSSIVTFIHASDVHISKYFAKGGLIHFLHFLRTAVPLISPRLVAVTGDLTDGKDKQRLTSQQQIDEWRAYRKALDESGVEQRMNGTFYRDQRGNHDCFNVFSFDSAENHFRTHAAVREPGYFLRLDEPFGSYSFVATDACPKHGFARPLNFFGYLDAD
ncbi:hypothetical protein LPJ73_008560, partial [Coemansia sp. RSA 2703]